MKKLRRSLLLAVFAFSTPLLAQNQAPLAASPDTVSPLKIGQKLPEISLLDAAKNVFPLTKSLRNGPVVLVVYRGGWCPYCNVQLSELGKIEPQLLKLGYRIVAISPDASEKLAGAATKNKLRYKLLADPQMQAAQSLGLAFQVDAATAEKYREYGISLPNSPDGRAKTLPVPAVYLIGRDGVVDFSYVNPDYKTRVPGDLVLAAAKAFAE